MPDRTELLGGLRQASEVLAQFVQTIPADQLDLRRGENFWTIAEHVSHLAQVQPMLLERLERFVKEEHPQFVPYIPGDDEHEPDSPARMNMDDALAQFADYRDQQTVLIKNVGERVWQKEATHPEYEHYSFHILVRHLLMHDYWHMYRMEELWLTKDAYLTALE
jgi:uncharacterized damage-inducible protein DinB